MDKVAERQHTLSCVSPSKVRVPRRLLLLFAATLAPAHLAHAQHRAPIASFAWSASAPQPAVLQARVDPCGRSTGRVLLQLGAGLAGAWIGGAWGFEIGDEFGTSKPQGDAVLNRAGNNGYIVGSLIGSTLAVYLTGNRPRRCGSAWRSGLGSAMATSLLLLDAGDAYLPIIGVLFVAPLQSVGGVALYR
jgi:hypothetical protein